MISDKPSELSCELQSTPVLLGERVAFTGTLASMTHRQAMDLVEQQGGQAMQHVGQQTSILVVGEEGWPLELDGQPSVQLGLSPSNGNHNNFIPLPCCASC